MNETQKDEELVGSINKRWGFTVKEMIMSVVFIISVAISVFSLYNKNELRISKIENVNDLQDTAIKRKIDRLEVERMIERISDKNDEMKEMFRKISKKLNINKEE